MHKEVKYSREKWTQMELLIPTIFLINAIPWCALKTNNLLSKRCPACSHLTHLGNPARASEIQSSRKITNDQEQSHQAMQGRMQRTKQPDPKEYSEEGFCQPTSFAETFKQKNDDQL